MEKGNIVNMDYVELEAGAEKPGTKREAFVFEVGTGYNVYKMDDEIIGMKKGETKLITKVFPEDFETSALAGKTVTLRVTLNSIKEKKLPEINDELAQDISEKFKTLDELKADIRTQARARREVRTSVRAPSPACSTPSWRRRRSRFPQSMVDYQLENMWQEYVSQMRIDEKKLVAASGGAGHHHGEPAQGVAAVRGKAGAPAARDLRDRKAGEHRHRGRRTGRGDREDGGGAQGRPRTSSRRALREEQPRGLHEVNLRMDKLYDFLLSKTTLRAGEKRKVLDILQGN